jgi:hypothetical protein
LHLQRPLFLVLLDPEEAPLADLRIAVGDFLCDFRPLRALLSQLQQRLVLLLAPDLLEVLDAGFAQLLLEMSQKLSRLLAESLNWCIEHRRRNTLLELRSGSPE